MLTLKRALKLMWLWPPFFGAGISVKKMNDDLTHVVVQMKLRFWNKNYVGTHFGGSLYSMTDPFYMLMVLHNLGEKYIVWDKSSTIRFKKPAKGKVFATFHLAPEKLAEIKKEADDNPKSEPVFIVQIKDEQGEVIAELDKIVYVKRKDKIRKD